MKIYILELKRALHEKNFWLILLFLIVFAVLVTPYYLSQKIMYDREFYNYLPYTTVDVWRFAITQKTMTIFLPLFPVLIYSHSFLDDVHSKFINNIVPKTGFKGYFKGKLYISMLLGGILYFLSSIFTFIIFKIIYYGEIDPSVSSKLIYKISILSNIKLTFKADIYYVLTISFILFILGAIYGAVGFLISLYTDNKLLVYCIAALVLTFYECSMYFISLIIQLLTKTNYSVFYNQFSIFEYLGNFTSIKVLFNNVIIFIIIINLIWKRYNHIENSYYN